MSLTLIDSGNEAKRPKARPHEPSFAQTLKAGSELFNAGKRTLELRLALGKALCEECGPPGANGKHNGSAKRLKQAHEALLRAGIRFNIDYLRDLRQFFHKFPNPGDRSPGVSYTVHLKAGDPETLRAVVAKARKEGIAPEAIRVKDVREFLEQQALERERENRAAHDKLKNRAPAGDVAYLDALNKRLAAAAKAVELAKTKRPTPRSDADRQKLHDADQKVIDAWTAAP